MSGLWLPLVFALGSVTLLWLVSLSRKDASIIDIWWGPAIALSIDLAAFESPRMETGGIIGLVLVNLWGLRLGGHILLRHRGEDYRYAAMREKFGLHWWWSLFQVFLLQGILIWLVAGPLLWLVMLGAARSGVVEICGFLLVAAGLILEGVADWQLTGFRADPSNKAGVLDTGVWAWSRHPNYFGDCAMWWGFFLAAWGAGGPWWLIESPLIMTLLLLKVSGVTLLEDSIGTRRPGYDDYVRRTSAFIPWPPSSPSRRRR